MAGAVIERLEARDIFPAGAAQAAQTKQFSD